MTAILTAHDCDFCEGETTFKKVYDPYNLHWWLEGLGGAGSDHLATWCGECGPKHR